jgi:prophage antirepressor-like protein
MNKVTLFDFNEQPVRVVMGDDDVPWWVAADVCRVLDLKNSRDAVSGLDDDEKGVADADTLRSNVGSSDSGDIRIPNRGLGIINESGLYTLIFKSRKPEARAFKRWVTGVVLPAIRRTGMFVAAEQPAPVPTEPVPVTEAARLEAVQGYLFKAMVLFSTGRSTPVELNATTSWAARVYEGMDRTRRVQAMELHAVQGDAWRRFFECVLPMLGDVQAHGAACMVRHCWLKSGDDLLPPDAFENAADFGAAVKARLADASCQLRVLPASQTGNYPRAFRVLFLAAHRLHGMWTHRLAREGHAVPSGLEDLSVIRRACEGEPWFLSGEAVQRFDGEVHKRCWAIALESFPFADSFARPAASAPEAPEVSTSQP